MKKILLSLLTAISFGTTGCSAQSDSIDTLAPQAFIKQAKAQHPLFSMYAHLANIKKSIWLEPGSSTFSIHQSSMLESKNSTIPTPIMYTAEAASVATTPVSK